MFLSSKCECRHYPIAKCNQISGNKKLIPCEKRPFKRIPILHNRLMAQRNFMPAKVLQRILTLDSEDSGDDRQVIAKQQQNSQLKTTLPTDRCDSYILHLMPNYTNFSL